MPCQHEITVVSIGDPRIALSTVLFCIKCTSVVGWSLKDDNLLRSDLDMKISGKARKFSTAEKSELR
jgi:hypothetical protein